MAEIRVSLQAVHLLSMAELPVCLQDTAKQIPCLAESHPWRFSIFPIEHPTYDWLAVFKCPICKTLIERAGEDPGGAVGGILAILYTTRPQDNKESSP